jgi:23S rRNA (pseudouridine1915-N3)-methyltransferase
MKVQCFFVGKTSVKYLEEGIQVYLKRLIHYLPVETIVIPSPNITNSSELVKKESDAILKKITEKDFVIVLDEKGKEHTSVQFADLMSKLMVRGLSKVVFIIGGAYGVSEEVRKRANLVLSFSKFTLTHQMIRLFLMEQLYRAMTIIRNEQYHNP